MTYGTQCYGCESVSEHTYPFYELEIHLKPNCILEDCIASLLSEERLEGANQCVLIQTEGFIMLTGIPIRYNCEHCHGLRDAKRFNRIKSLPPVLHFSLMRFVYDFDMEERRKTNNCITFPAVLDMSFFTGEDTAVYDLKGVLLHQGSSAHFGHYTVDLFDNRLQKWFSCDDEIVLPKPDVFTKRKNLKRKPAANSNPRTKARAANDAVKGKVFVGCGQDSDPGNASLASQDDQE